jgi:large subunit ribosomal protein L20
MSRVKRGVTVRRKHNKVLALTKGFKWGRKNVFVLAKQAAMKAGENSYRDRRRKKRDFRKLWIQRISAGLLSFKVSYSRFVYNAQNAHIRLNRKMLADLAALHPKSFEAVVKATQ